jgi:dihydroorotate dehydrogenase (fumarate)
LKRSADNVPKQWIEREREGNDMNLKTEYLGLRLRTPLVPSASPLSESLDDIKRMEDAGASAIVFHSLFEEHITFERHQLHYHFAHGPEMSVQSVGPESYLDEIVAAKDATSIPIIASLNGSTLGGWTDYAKRIEEAGADALELNIYWIPTDPELTGAEVELRYKQIVSQVKATIGIPIAVKLSPFFSNIANIAKALAEAGAKGLVLFNRFYKPDIDLESLDVTPNIPLSTPMAMRLPLRWIAILRDRIEVDLAATSGVHRATDVVKLLLAGADVTMLCSVLLRDGIDHLRVIEREMEKWMEKHDYESVAQLKGSMSQKKCADPTAFERAQYIRGVSTSWRTPNLP